MRNTFVQISKSALISNIMEIKKMCGHGVAVCAVVKADAYGHSMVGVANILQEYVDYFAVAIIDEGVKLRKNGITKPILVFGSIHDDDIEIGIRNDLALTVPSVDKLLRIVEIGKMLHTTPIVHLKIDTGMGRIGVQWDRSEDFINQAAYHVQQNSIVCEGIYSHFADSLDDNFSKIQFDRFMLVVNHIKQCAIYPKYIHICSSRAMILHPEYRLTMVRPGIALYGIEPECDLEIYGPRKLIPVMKWISEISYFKVLKNGDSVGYGRIYKVRDQYERIITLPVGYADGFPRELSNKGNVILNGNIYPVVGRVCMDQIMVSIGKSGIGHVGDTVILVGSERDASICVEDIARLVDTTPHEITTRISPRVPRRFVE